MFFELRLIDDNIVVGTVLPIFNVICGEHEQKLVADEIQVDGIARSLLRYPTQRKILDLSCLLRLTGIRISNSNALISTKIRDC